MPSQRQTSHFDDLLTDEVEIKLPKNILEKCINFIRTEMTPDDVWDDDILRKYVEETSLPEDVFNDKKLSEWAENNGYIKE